MKCTYHPGITATATCFQCHKFLCEQCAVAEGDDLFICTRCLALKAAGEGTRELNRRRQEEEKKRRLQEAGKKRKNRIWTASLWSTVFICICIIAIQVPKLVGLNKVKAIRHGTYATDAKTDQCINNLWYMARLLQEGRWPGKDTVCPASNKSYVTSTINNEWIVQCPSPEIHGFKQIVVRKTRPMPELIN